jgi:hypothetical protein
VITHSYKYLSGAEGLKRIDDSMKSKLRLKTTDETAILLLKQIYYATRESHSGQFWNFDGTKIEW